MCLHLLPEDKVLLILGIPELLNVSANWLESFVIQISTEIWQCICYISRLIRKMNLQTIFELSLASDTYLIKLWLRWRIFPELWFCVFIINKVSNPHKLLLPVGTCK